MAGKTDHRRTRAAYRWDARCQARGRRDATARV